MLDSRIFLTMIYKINILVTRQLVEIQLLGEMIKILNIKLLNDDIYDFK